MGIITAAVEKKIPAHIYALFTLELAGQAAEHVAQRLERKAVEKFYMDAEGGVRELLPSTWDELYNTK